MGSIVALLMLVGSAHAQSWHGAEFSLVAAGAAAGAVVGGVGGAVAAGPIGGFGGAALGAGIGGTIGMLASGTERMLSYATPRPGRLAYARLPAQRPAVRQRVASARVARVRERTCIEGRHGVRCIETLR